MAAKAPRKSPKPAAPEPAGADALRQEHQRAIAVRLKRVEGQVRGIVRMLEGDADCEAVSQQLAAARKALDGAYYELMACSLEQVMLQGGQDAARQAEVAAMLRMFRRYA